MHIPYDTAPRHRKWPGAARTSTTPSSRRRLQLHRTHVPASRDVASNLINQLAVTADLAVALSDYTEHLHGAFQHGCLSFLCETTKIGQKFYVPNGVMRLPSLVAVAFPRIRSSPCAAACIRNITSSCARQSLAEATTTSGNAHHLLPNRVISASLVVNLLCDRDRMLHSKDMEMCTHFPSAWSA